jgi:glutamate N-acetyltransferase/amino-acid N-acetyltransferase
MSIAMNGMAIFELGEPVASYDEAALTKSFANPEVSVDVRIGRGKGKATVWSCDLTHEYISINGDYRT